MSFQGQWRVQANPSSAVVDGDVKWSYVESGIGSTRLSGSVQVLTRQVVETHMLLLRRRAGGIALTQELVATHEPELWWNLHARQHSDLSDLFAALIQGNGSRRTAAPPARLCIPAPPDERIDSVTELAKAIKMLGTAPLDDKGLTLDRVYAAVVTELQRSSNNVKALASGLHAEVRRRDRMPPDPDSASRLRAALQLVTADATDAHGAWLVGWAVDSVAGSDPQHLKMGALFAYTGIIKHEAALSQAGMAAYLKGGGPVCSRLVAQSQATRQDARDDLMRAELLAYRTVEQFHVTAAQEVLELVQNELDFLAGAGDGSDGASPDKFLSHGNPRLLGRTVVCVDSGKLTEIAGTAVMYNRKRQQVIVRMHDGDDVLFNEHNVKLAID